MRLKNFPLWLRARDTPGAVWVRFVGPRNTRGHTCPVLFAEEPPDLARGSLVDALTPRSHSPRRGSGGGVGLGAGGRGGARVLVKDLIDATRGGGASR